MGDLALALCQADPSFEDYQEQWIGTQGSDEWGCLITVKRRGRSPQVGRFTVADAKLAGLWGKRGRDGSPSPWVTYPQRMLRYRALGFVLRDAFPDVLKGVKTTEELQDYPEDAKNGFNHAKPVEATVVKTSETPDQQGTAQPDQSGNGNGNGEHFAPRPTGAPQQLEGIVERAWPNDYQGKRYYFAKVNGTQLQTTDEALGERLLQMRGQTLQAIVEPSPKPGKAYLKSIEEEPKVEEQPAAAQATTPNDTLPTADRTAYQELQQRINQAGATNEYWLLKAAKRLEWVPQRTVRLANLSDKSLRILLVRWTNLLEAAREEEKGIAPEKSA